MKKRVIAIFLSLAIFLALPLAASATNAVTDAAMTTQQAADALNSYGLFRGSDLGYELERMPTRNEALVMLIRLMGKEADALAGTWEHPFRDVADWVKPYVGYAYEKGITKGTGPDTFGGDSPAVVNQYLTFLLRALGFRDDLEDFSYSNPFWLTDSLFITNGEYDIYTDLTRGDVALTSYRALDARLKNSRYTLFQTLKNAGAIPAGSTYPSETEALPYILAETSYYELSVGETVEVEFYLANEEECWFGWSTWDLDHIEIEYIGQDGPYHCFEITALAPGSEVMYCYFMENLEEGILDLNPAALGIINFLIK